MNYITPLSLIIGYFFIISLGFVVTIHIIRNRKNYGTQFMGLLNAAIVFSLGVIHATFYILSVVFFISEQINILFWKFSILAWFISLIITSLLFSFFREYKKIKSFPFLFYTLFLGLLIGALLTPDSITLNLSISLPSSIIFIDPSLINYHFNFITGAITIVFQILIISHYLFIAIIINIRSKKKEETLPVILNAIIFSITITLNIFYVLFQYTLFRELFIRELFIIILWIAYFGVSIMIVKKPEMFFVLPNKIYSINIYHKSGILIYSYNFGSQTEFKTESTIWGNILIGLNHILSEFLDKKDKINVIQTKEADVVVKYEEDSGYALIVITNRKNSIVEDLMNNFSTEFKRKYKNELNEILDINRIINVSEFSDLKDLIEKNFQLYL
ncbi:MAG: hypothetical protein KAW66_08650 [Candidatus Lokiarchaeota archaeon]|nr:hypothetical protein [Candidatus Lokiarchaeota archaeon]